MIKSLDDKDNYEVMFFDEGRFGLRSTTMRMWGEKGKPLRVKVQQSFQNFYGYSAVNPFTGNSFSLLLPNVDTTNMNIFLSNLKKYIGSKKLILIMDQAGWHKSKGLKIIKGLQLVYLPPYSPELNPVEKLWEWLKKECSHNFIYKTLDDLFERVSQEYKNLTAEKLKRLCYCSYLTCFN